MRKRSKWVENVATIGIAILIGFVALPAVFYVHENAPQWEAAGIFISLGLGLAPALWYLRVKRHGWLVSILSGLLLMFSFGSALFHGWEAQALIVVAAGMGVVLVYIFVLRHRVTRSVETIMRAIDEEMMEDARLRGPLLFRDDGERITVYPNQRRLLIQCAGQALVLALLVGVLAFITIDNVLMLWLARLMTGLIVVAFLARLYRLVVRQPTLVVGPDGIFDHGTLVATGLGLIRWDEILSVRPYARSQSGVTQRYLSIHVPNGRAIRARQPMWKRIALRFTTSSSWSFDIWQGLLSVRNSELAEQIKRYVETHAPPGYLDEGDEEGEEGEEGEGAAGSTDSAPPPRL